MHIHPPPAPERRSWPCYDCDAPVRHQGALCLRCSRERGHARRAGAYNGACD